jgi:4-hydroxy-tetrahydrodipicolinate synthase
MKASVPYGAWPILLTPFNSTGGVDWLALDHIIDFYIAHQVPAILALGQASEVLALNMEECFEIDKRITLRSNGKIYTVAVGNFGLTLEKQAESLIRTVELGIDVAVVALSLLPSSDGLDDQLIRLADMTGNSIPLGIYELPEPEHRVLTPQQVKTIAQSGQYVFMKDTCRQITTFTEKSCFHH